MLRTAECVTPRHPDKLCDIISDSILDAYLEQDSDSRVAIETMGGHGIITITGEITTKAYVNMRTIARDIAGEQYGVQVNVVTQSPEIARGVDEGGAGDQGIMIGYACDENEALIPHELFLARSLCQWIYYATKIDGKQDGKTQITIDEAGEVKTIVASFCNIATVDLLTLISAWKKENDILEDCKIYCNPSGDWNIGGFEADTGLTGRKLAVDSYGPRIPLGGGAFSGKDASKVDRSGAYKARQVAVTLLRASNAKEVLVKIAYAIGVAEPIMLTAVVDGEEIDVLNANAKPKQIIESLDLKKPQFAKTAEWGHFGNGFKWDNI